MLIVDRYQSLTSTGDNTGRSATMSNTSFPTKFITLYHQISLELASDNGSDYI